MPAYNFTWIDTTIPALDWTQGVVQLGHHSYNPTKDDSGGTPNTWHWDNVQLSPAVPFTIIRGDRRFVDPTNQGVVRFAQPAPANAHLRFAAIGDNVEVSFDGGRRWQAAQKQAQFENDRYHFSNYWMAVAAGTSQVQVRAQGVASWGWHARDFSLFAR